MARSLRVFTVQMQHQTMIAAPEGDVRLLELDSGVAETEALDERFCTSTARNLVIDFEGCRYFGAVTLGLMLKLRRRVTARKGRMTLCNASPHLREVLQATGLDSVWSIYSTRADAVEAGLGAAAWRDASGSATVVPTRPPSANPLDTPAAK